MSPGHDSARPAADASAAAARVDKTPARIAGMFDAIAPRYDLLNHVLSAGLDRGWRDRAVEALALRHGSRVLDLCTGTADLAIAIARASPGTKVVGIDFAGGMLRLGLAKLESTSLRGSVALVRGDATRIPLAAGSCDAVTVAFGIRNVAEPDAALAEMGRVLKPGGRLAILEFGQPPLPGLKTMYGWYFRYLLPLIGRLVSRHDSAYSYLPASVGTFPPPAEFLQKCETSGFTVARAVPLTLGVVYLYVAQKRA